MIEYLAVFLGHSDCLSAFIVIHAHRSRTCIRRSCARRPRARAPCRKTPGRPAPGTRRDAGNSRNATQANPNCEGAHADEKTPGGTTRRAHRTNSRRDGEYAYVPGIPDRPGCDLGSLPGHGRATPAKFPSPPHRQSRALLHKSLLFFLLLPTHPYFILISFGSHEKQRRRDSRAETFTFLLRGQRRKFASIYKSRDGGDPATGHRSTPGKEVSRNIRPPPPSRIRGRRLAQLFLPLFMAPNLCLRHAWLPCAYLRPETRQKRITLSTFEMKMRRRGTCVLIMLRGLRLLRHDERRETCIFIYTCGYRRFYDFDVAQLKKHVSTVKENALPSASRRCLLHWNPSAASHGAPFNYCFSAATLTMPHSVRET